MQRAINKSGEWISEYTAFRHRGARQQGDKVSEYIAHRQREARISQKAFSTPHIDGLGTRSWMGAISSALVTSNVTRNINAKYVSHGCSLRAPPVAGNAPANLRSISARSRRWAHVANSARARATGCDYVISAAHSLELWRMTFYF